MIFNDLLSSSFLAPHNKSMFLESLLPTALICSFLEIFSSNITLKNLMEACLFENLLIIFKYG